MIPGVTLGPRQGGPVGAALTGAAASATPAAASSAPFGEFVAWLAQGMAAPEASAPLAGRGRSAPASADESSPSADGAGDPRAETAPGLVVPLETTLPSPVVVWATTPATTGTLPRDEAARPVSDRPAGLHSADVSAPSMAGAGAVDTMAALVVHADVASPPPADDAALPALVATAGQAIAAPEQVQVQEVGRQVATPAPERRVDTGRRQSMGDRPESTPDGRRISRHPHTDIAERRGETRAADVAAAPAAEERETRVHAAVGVVVRDAAPAVTPEPGVAQGRATSVHQERPTGALVANAAPAVTGVVDRRDGGPAAPPTAAATPQPVAEPPSPQAAEIAASVGLRLRRGVMAAATPAASPHASPVGEPGAEPVVTPAPRGTDGAAVALRARDGLSVADGVPAVGHRERDVPTPASGVLAALEPRDSGRGSLGVAEAATAQDGPALDDVLPTQIIRTIRLQWQAGQGEARVQLRPDYLGELTVAVKVDQGAVTATLHAESPDVRRWLESHSGSLRDALAEQGLRLDRLVVADEHGRQDAPDAERRDRQAGHDGEAPSRRRRGRPSADGSTFDVPTFDSPERTPA